MRTVTVNDQDLQRLKQRAIGKRKPSKYKFTKAGAEYTESLIDKGLHTPSTGKPVKE